MSISLFVTTILLSNVCVTEEYNWYDLKNSASKFIDQISNFFRVTDLSEIFTNLLDKIEIRRRKIKEAIRTFLFDAFGDRQLQETRRNPPKNNIIMATRTEKEPLSRYIYEKKSTAAQLIQFHGYQAETHSVQTRDGYILQIQRIISLSKKSATRKMALLYHGLMGSSEDWLLLGPGKALPYLLSDAGYDVWLTNARGNTYSQFDSEVDPNMFWDFSFHEMGIYDLPAVIDYIETRTDNDLEINFIGHSLGGTALLVLLSTLPQYNLIMKSATLLAPLAYMYQIHGPLRLLAEFYGKYGLDSLHFLGDKEFQPKKSFPLQFALKYCNITEELCVNPLFFIANAGHAAVGEDIKKLILSHVPNKVSTKVIKHYLQLVNSGDFHNYDYGEDENIKKHGNVLPPPYNLSRITLPIILFGSKGDWLCTIPNLQTLSQMLPNVLINHVIKNNDFSHTDFVWGDDAPTLVYKPLIDILESLYNTKVYIGYDEFVNII